MKDFLIGVIGVIVVIAFALILVMVRAAERKNCEEHIAKIMNAPAVYINYHCVVPGSRGDNVR